MKDRRDALKGLNCALGMLLIVPALLLFAFDRGALDRGFHQRLYDELGSARAAGVDEGTLAQIGDMLVDYLNGARDDRSGPRATPWPWPVDPLDDLNGARDDLAMTAAVNGVEQPVFNEREIAHMADVKGLFDLERRVRAIFVWLGLALLALGLPGPGWARRLMGAGLIGQAFWLSLLAFAAAWAAIDFNGVFLRFHGLLFANDLWQLNPATDLMIRMLPEKFFAAVAVHAAGRMLIFQALLLTLWALPTAIARRMARGERA